MKRMKRAIALLLAVVMCFSVCPVSAFATTTGEEASTTETTEPHPEQDTMESPTVPVPDEEEQVVPETEPPLEVTSEEDPEEPTESEVEIVANGSCGTNVYWELDTEGMLRISTTGAGVMNNYSSGSSSKPAYSYRSQVLKLVVEEGITSIGNYAFYNYTNLKEVSLPETLTKIGNYAFQSCTSLTEIVIPDSVTELGYYVFNNCTSLTKAVLTDGITSLGERTFYGCTSLVDVDLPENLVTIGIYAFYNCKALPGITFPESLTTIGNYAFKNCTAITGTLVIPDLVTSIGTEAFYNCDGLIGLVVDDSATSIGGHAFYDCDGLLSVELGDCVTTIGNNAFYSCNALVSLDLGNGVTSIGSYAFQGCSAIAGELVIPDSVKTIGYQAFYDLDKITSIFLGAGLTRIEDYVFYSCGSVLQVTFTGTIAPTIYSNSFSSMSKLASVTVPLEGYSSFVNAFGASFSTKLRLQCSDDHSDMVIVDDVLVAYFGNDTTVEIPEGVRVIGDGAFMHCTTLTSVVIPDTVTEIGNYAFDYCTNLVDIQLPYGLTRIGKYAFYYCQKMTAELNLTDDLTELGAYAFYYCQKITGDVYLSDHLTAVEPYTFYYCSSLKGTLRLPSNLTEIKTYAFAYCSGLQGALKLPITLTAIRSYAFLGCSGLTGDLVLPNSVTTLEYCAFQNCSGFDGSLVLSEGLKSISSSAFSNCSKITGELVIPDTVTSYIDSNAFYGMKGLTSVVIGPNVTRLYSYAFQNCTGLETLTFTGLTPPTIDYGNFDGMNSLKAIYVPSGVFEGYMAKFGTNVPKTARILTSDLVEDEFLIIDNVLLSYLGKGGEVTIPDTVTAIAAYAFQGCTDVTKVNIPESVTSIGNYAFRSSGLTEINLPSSIHTIGTHMFSYCADLTELVIPETVTTIGNYAFQGCIGLTELVIPDTVTAIGDYAFRGCTDLTSLDTGDGVVTIGTYAFEGCTGLVNVVIGDAVTSIGTYAFHKCSELVTLNLGSNLETIGEYAFYQCQKLEALELGDAVISVGQRAFYECKGMKHLDLGSSVQTIGQYAFYSCTGLTGDLVIPDSVTSMGYQAFYNCNSLDGTLTLSNGLKTIPGYAFYNCQKITGELVIPDSVTTIGDYAFEYLYGLTSITLGSGVDKVTSVYPFYYCTNVTSFTFTGVTPPTFSYNPFYGMSKLETVYVPMESLAQYKTALKSYLPTKATIKAIGATDFVIKDGVLVGYQGADTEVTIPDTVTAIGYGAFQNNTAITSVVIPDTVTAIDDYAFRGCTALTTVNLPASVSTIGNYAFYSCSKLTGELVLPEALTTIGNYAFAECTGLTGTLTLTNGLTTIGSNAFYNCNKISGELVIPDSVKSIGDLAFYNLSKITSITIGSGVETMGSSTSYNQSPFYCCSSVTQFTFRGETAPAISSNIFYSMSKLPAVWIPAGTYADYAAVIKSFLTYSTRIRCMNEEKQFVINEDGVLIAYLGDDTAIEIPEGVTAIGDAAFIHNKTMTSVVIPDTVTTIGEYAFRGCSNLTGALVLHDGITEIGRYAFYGCSGLTGSLVMPDSITNIGTYAFYGCTGLNGTLKLPANLTVVNQYTFYNCKNIVGEVVVPDNVTTIADYAFTNMSSITSVVLGSGVTQVGSTSNYTYMIFSGCNKMVDLTFTGKLPSFAGNPFSGSYLRRIHVPEEEFIAYLDVLGSYLPTNARVVTIEMEEDFLIQDGVLLAYQGVGGDVVIPEGVTSIGKYAFHGCKEITSIQIPEGVTSIGAYAFRNCSGLTRIVMPNSLRTIGNYAFYNCDALSGTLVISDGVTTIGSYTFNDCDGITGLDLGSGVKSIGERAFEYCDALTGDLILPDSLTSLGTYAFHACYKLNGMLKLSEKLTTIPVECFWGCPFSGEVVIPDSVTTIESYAFETVNGVKSFVLGTGVTSISSSAFSGCSAVVTMMFMGTKVPTISGNIFSSMSKLEKVYVPAEAYDAYVAKFSSWLGGTDRISTDFVTARITNLVADRVYSNTVALSWNPHTSSSVVGYNVYSGSEVLAENLIGSTSECWFAIRGLETGSSYTYTVQGYTEDGRVTGIAQVTAKTVLPQVKDIKSGNTYNKVNEDSNTIYIYVTNSRNLLPLVEENTVCAVYSDDVHIGDAVLDTEKTNSSTAIYTLNWDMTGWADGEHEIRAVLTDIDGASAEYTETLIIDRVIPAQIVGVTATGDHDVLHISWAMAAETDTHVYRIYRRTETDGPYRLVAQINNRETLTYTDKTIKKDRVYYYYVVGVNELDQEGVPSVVVAATLAPDTQAPVVTKLSPANGTYLKSTVTVQVTAQDDIALDRVELEYSRDDGATWTFLAELSASSLRTNFDTTVLEDGVIRMRATAFDASGNISAPLEYVYFIDNHGPEKVRGLSYESTSVTITLEWNDVSDADIKYYRVEQKLEDGTYITVADQIQKLGHNIYNLTPGTEYTYRVVGYDTQGNRGTPSDDIVASTLRDTTAPVITKIRPNAGYYADVIPLEITAEDEYQIRSITVQVSMDLMNWVSVFVQNYAGTSKTQNLYYNLDLTRYEEGAIYIRAIAKDIGGNTSDASVNAPYVQYIIDRTAPAKPQNVKAVGQCGYIEISWNQGVETDLNGYCVYRADAEDGEYVLLEKNLKTINYYDRTVTEGKVYYYIVAACDKAGNLSAFSEVVFSEVGEDTEPPVIVTIYPASGSVIGSGNNAVSVTATDNHMLQSLRMEYSADGIEYKLMYELPDISQYDQYADARIPVEEFEDGDTVYLRVTAADQTGNTSEPFDAFYTIDAVAPKVENARASYNSETESVEITWTGCQEADIYGYRIYRVVKDTETLLAFLPAVAGQREYSRVDASLPVEKTSCVYRIEAVDRCGNPGPALTDVVELPDRQFPRVVLYCDNTMEIGVEYTFDATASTDNENIVSYLFDFGDGTTSTEPTVIHAYEELGEYTVTLSVTDNDGHVSTTSKTITVVERSAIGTVKIQILDENGRAVPNAPVYFDLGEETQTMKLTDSTGCAIFTSTAGVHAVGCIIPNNEWLPAKKEVIILAGAQTTVPMTLVHQPLIEGVFEVNRMTFDEIVAAGIDVSKPENQHIVSVGVKLTYGSAEQETSFIFNMTTKEALGDLTYDRDNDGHKDREIVPVLLSEKSIAYLDLPIGASLLKEFFDVRLTIINNASSEFSMLDNVVTLNLPEGLSIVESAGSESNATVEINEIPGQSTKTVSWILRGDQEGEYSLSADYSGLLSDFDEPIYTTFLAKEPIKVYGLSAVKLIAEVNSSVNFDAFYFNLALENVSDIDVNMPSIQIEDHVLTAYLSRVFEFLEPDGSTSTGYTDPTVTEPEVRHLNTILSNANGYRQYIGTETAVQTLASGEKLTNQYAAYNVTGYDNLMLLQEAIREVAEDCGIQFEVNVTDMDLFSTENAVEKLENVRNDETKLASFDEILDCSRYFYVLESLDRSNSMFIKENENLYDSMKKYMAASVRSGMQTAFPDATAEEIDKNIAEATVELTRAIVAQLMVDESMQQAIETTKDAKYLQVTTALVSKLGELLTGDDLTVWNDYLTDGNQLRTMSDKLEKFGLAQLVEYLAADLKAAGVSEEGIAGIRSYYDSGELASALGEAVANVCTLVGGAVEKLNGVCANWSESPEIVIDLIRVAAAQQEIHLLLDMLIEHTGEGSLTRRALENIRSGMTGIETRLAENFALNLNEALADGTDATTAILACLDSVYGAGTGPSYTLVKLTFGSVGDVLTWDGITTDCHVLSMCTEISLALRQAVEHYGLGDEQNPLTDAQAVYTMTALKYLIKMRLIGEQCFVRAMGHLSKDEREAALAWVNKTNGTSHETLQAYLSAVQVRLLTYRDNIFSSYYTNLEIADAPEVTIDFEKGTAVVTSSSDCEYSFTGSDWQSCNGETIAFTPAAVNQYLWVRVKGTDSAPAGNITKVVIPAMSRITGDITMIYIEDGYQISGLSAGTYRYAFTDDRADVELTGTITVEEGEIIKILEEKDDWRFIALGTAETEAAFASQIRYVAAERPWYIDTDTYVITGREDETTALQLVYYYESKGYVVTVVDKDGNETELVGTGCVINLDGESHKVVVSGDVDGDAKVTMEDLAEIIGHINSEKELTDEYFDAARLCENDYIDLFDLWAELTYIQNKQAQGAD